MPKILTLFLLFGLLLSSLIGCQKVGNITSVNLDPGSSVSYTQEEIKAAMNTVTAYFQQNFSGCTLTKLWYAENQVLAAEAEWASQYRAEQAIVLLSDFTTDAQGGDGSLNPNQTYTNWQWILVRNNGENWQLKDWGY